MKTQLIIIGLILSIVFIAGCATQTVPIGWDDKNFDIEKVTNVSCNKDSDCETPAEYLAMSRCPFTSKCIENKCNVVCPKQLVGNDRDEHGCIPSAGYSWCEEKQKCLRTWEESCSELKACTEEAKLCPDGTAVGRNSENNCEFDPCPTEAHICTAKEKAAEICTMDYTPVCGDDGITYGNGCSACASKKIDSYTLGECPEKELEKHYCTDEQRTTNICPSLYAPVCGWFHQSIQCIKYPCAATYANYCSACLDPKVDYRTEGECPE